MNDRIVYYQANSDYEETDLRALHLQVGQKVLCGPADQTWPGWIWAKSDDGRNGYVPEQFLKSIDDSRFEVIEDFDSTVLKLVRGQNLQSLRQIHGWHWCRDESGKEGWVAGYLLRPKDPVI